MRKTLMVLGLVLTISIWRKMKMKKVVMLLGLLSISSGAMAGLQEGIDAEENHNWEAAYKEFKPLAAKGNPIAQYYLGFFYEQGYVVQKNYQEAWKLYNKSAQQGYSEAQHQLGSIYDHGSDNFKVQENKGEALKWYVKSAEQGNKHAQSALGGMYYYGSGVPQDYREAMKWNMKLANEGDQDSQYILGEAFENGNGVSVDYSEAAYWYEKAAEKRANMAYGDLTSMFRLGVIYYEGRPGVPRDIQKAHHWLKESASHGYSDSIAAMQQVFREKVYP